MIDPHMILGVSRQATAEEIRRAYLQKAKKYHPDAGGDSWAFAQVLEAYQQLGGKVPPRDSTPPTAAHTAMGARAADFATTSASSATESSPRPDPSPRASVDRPAARVRAAEHRAKRRHHRGYGRWRLFPDSYSQARFPSRPKALRPSTSTVIWMAVVLWVTALCFTGWLIVRANTRPWPVRIPIEQPYRPPQKLEPNYLDLGPNTL